MEMQDFVRKPFVVSAVEITDENIAELAELVGELRHKEDGTPFIQVNRRLVPNVFRAYPGFWVTQMGDNVRCYSKKIFLDQFLLMDEELSVYVGRINGIADRLEELPQPAAELVVDIPVGTFQQVEEDPDCD